MASFVVLLKKELRGNLRTYRLLIVVALFFVLGLGTPLLLNYVDAFLPSDDGGMVLPEFTAADVANEYISSIGQFGLIAAILLAMGSLARERESGTAAMTLSKPVGRGAFVGAKLTALGLVFGVGLAVGALGCYAYTVVLFGRLSASQFLLGNLVAALYILVCLAVTLMYSAFFRNQLAAGGLALMTLIALAATAGLQAVKGYSPGGLIAWSTDIVSESGPNAWGALAAGIGLVVVAAIIGWQVFERKEL